MKERMTVTIDPKVIEDAKKVAKDQSRSLSSLIEWLMKSEVKKTKGK